MHDHRPFHYRPPWRVTSGFPGAHHGMQRGSGYELHGVAPLLSGGDPRRFDVRASLRDPFGRLMVRNYKQRGVAPVVALADISASMSFTGRSNKYAMLIEFVRALAYSAYKTGDPFALCACDSQVRRELSLPMTRMQGAGALAAQRLDMHRPTGADSSGLLRATDELPGSRSLVFLISDFHLPDAMLRSLLERLSRHGTIPVVLEDSGEDRIPARGIAHVYDPETNQRRITLLRPALADRLRKRVAQKRERIDRALADFDLRPLKLVDRFDPQIVSSYFYA